MERDLEKFNDNLSLINKEIVEYKDKKGNEFIVALTPKYQHIAQLFLNCEYLEADNRQLKTLEFNGTIEKGQFYEKEMVKRQVPKYELTHKEKDKNIIVDKEIIINKIWVVKNGFKLTKSFTEKEEALKFVKEENEKIIKKFVDDLK